MPFDNNWFWSPYMIPIAAIVGGIILAVINSFNRTRIRELEIRERIAMIERGMVPSPETDPGGFEKRMHTVERMQHRHVGSRFRSGGIMVMTVGFALMTMLYFVGAGEDVALGIGGFLVIIGLGLVVNGFLSAPSIPPLPPGTGPQS
jgi:hypothetical protein